MVTMRIAETKDINDVVKLYQEVTEQIKNYESNPEWIKGVYPKEEYIEKLVESGEVYIGEIDDVIVSSIVINHAPNEGYDDVKWNINVDDTQVYYIHLVAVNQNYKKRGIAKQMMKYSFDLARKNSIKCIRLSLNRTNLAIENLYKQFDFKLVDSITVLIEDRGLKSFNVYEKII